jgi:carboxymethylenebutenolidase
VGIGAGYTLAAGLVVAQTIVTTRTDGLVAGDVMSRRAIVTCPATAPDYYVRQGDPKNAPDVQSAAAIAMRKADDELFRDLDASCAWATADGGNADKLVIIGFCQGGRNVWEYAAQNARPKTGVA